MSNPVDELKYCLPQKYWEKIECSDDVLDFAGDFINELQSEVERLRDALKQNAIWTEEDNTKALSDPKFATMLWRGCVATASEALNKAEGQLQKDSSYEQVESKCNEEVEG